MPQIHAFGKRRTSRRKVFRCLKIFNLSWVRECFLSLDSHKKRALTIENMGFTEFFMVFLSDLCDLSGKKAFKLRTGRQKSSLNRWQARKTHPSICGNAGKKRVILAAKQIATARRRELTAFKLHEHQLCSTLLYVAALAAPIYKVEIDAWASRQPWTAFFRKHKKNRLSKPSGFESLFSSIYV